MYKRHGVRTTLSRTWEKIALEKNVVLKGSEISPYQIAATQAPRYYIPVEQHVDPVRADITFHFPAYSSQPRSGSGPGTPASTEDHSTNFLLPSPLHRISYYGLTDSQTALRDRFVISEIGSGLTNFAGSPATLDLHFRAASENQHAERNYTMTKNSHGLWVSDTVVRPGDRIPAGGGDYIINISNTSARFKFLTPGSVDYRYLSTDQLKPRRIARWTDSHFTILRSSSLGGGDNHWVGGPSLPRDDIPDYGYIYFRCQIPNRFRIMSSNRLPTLGIKGLDYAGDPNDINTNNNAGPHRDPRPVYDLGTGSIIDLSLIHI